MATVSAGAQPNYSASINLCTALTGNVDSTNVFDRGSYKGPGALKIVSTIGATPTVTVNIQGSVDATNFFNIAYATTAAPETPVVTALTITTATTQHLLLRTDHAWRYLKIVLSANTNVTLTADVYI